MDTKTKDLTWFLIVAPKHCQILDINHYVLICKVGIIAALLNNIYVLFTSNVIYIYINIIKYILLMIKFIYFLMYLPSKMGYYIAEYTSEQKGIHKGYKLLSQGYTLLNSLYESQSFLNPHSVAFYALSVWPKRDLHNKLFTNIKYCDRRGVFFRYTFKDG